MTWLMPSIRCTSRGGEGLKGGLAEAHRMLPLIGCMLCLSLAADCTCTSAGIFSCFSDTG